MAQYGTPGTRGVHSGAVGEELQYFGYAEAVNVGMEDPANPDVLPLLEATRVFESALIRHQVCRLTPSSSRGEERERQAQLGSLAEAVEAAYAQLMLVLPKHSAGSVQVASASPQVSEVLSSEHEWALHTEVEQVSEQSPAQTDTGLSPEVGQSLVTLSAKSDTELHHDDANPQELRSLELGADQDPEAGQPSEQIMVELDAALHQEVEQPPEKLRDEEADAGTGDATLSDDSRGLWEESSQTIDNDLGELSEDASGHSREEVGQDVPSKVVSTPASVEQAKTESVLPDSRHPSHPDEQQPPVSPAPNPGNTDESVVERPTPVGAKPGSIEATDSSSTFSELGKPTQDDLESDESERASWQPEEVRAHDSERDLRDNGEGPAVTAQVDSDTLFRKLVDLFAPQEQTLVEVRSEEKAHPQTNENLVNAASAYLHKHLGSWQQLPRSELIVTWLANRYPPQAAAYPPPGLFEVAYFAFRANYDVRHMRCPDLSALRSAMLGNPSGEIEAACWQVAAGLVVIRGCLPAWELLECRNWLSQSEFEPWTRMVETLDTYLRQGTDSLPEVATRLRSNSRAEDSRQERDAAQRILAALARPGRFNFLKGQRLASLMDKELAWLRKSLSQESPDERMVTWVKDFKPERQLDHWSAKVEPLTVDIYGPVRQSLIRDLQALHMHVSRWVRENSGARAAEKAKRDAMAFAFQQLGGVVRQEASIWRRAWIEATEYWPTLAGWSGLLLDRLEDAVAPTYGSE